MIVQLDHSKLPFYGFSFLIIGCFPAPGPPKCDIAELLWASGAKHVILVADVCIDELSEESLRKLMSARNSVS